MTRIFREIAAPDHLIRAVTERIARVRRRMALVRLCALCASFSLSCLILIPAIRYASGEFYASGFYEYLKLAFSDAAIFSHWIDLAYTLTESIPSLALLILAATSLTLVWSLISIIRNARVVIAPAKHA